MALDPVFAITPRRGSVQATAANTNRDGTGTIATLLTAGTSGTKVTRIKAKAVGTTTAGMLRFYIHDGTNARLFTEVAVSAITPSGTVAAWEMTDLTFTDLVLPASHSIRVSTHNAETFNVAAWGADL